MRIVGPFAELERAMLREPAGNGLDEHASKGMLAVAGQNSRPTNRKKSSMR